MTAHCAHQEISAQGPIEIWEDGDRRWLGFGGMAIQSAMHLERPHELLLSYSHTMMAGLLFMPRPKRALILGVGGASLARYLNHYLPDCSLTGVESSEAVLRLCKEWFLMPQDWQIHHEDARRYISNSKRRFDLILMDISSDDGSPDWLLQPEFLQQCKQRLSNKGLLILNTLPKDAAWFTELLRSLRDLFPDKTAVCTVADHRNVILYAAQTKNLSAQELDKQAAKLSRKLDLPLIEILTQMRKDNPPNSGLF